MLPSKAPQGSARSQSLHSTIAEDKLYENVDPIKLYTAVLKVVLVDYMSEGKFYKATPQAPRNGSPTRAGGDLRGSRKSRYEPDALLPPYLLAELKVKLNLVAMKKTTHDELTRRLLLRFYGEMLDPAFGAEVARANSVDILVMKFVSSANKELTKLGLIPADDISAEVFRHAESFIKIIILLVQKDKNADTLVAKLKEHRASLKPKLPPKDPAPPSNLTYTEPSFKLADMDLGYITLLKLLFAVDDAKMQADVNQLKTYVTQKSLCKDLDQVLFYISKDIGKFSPDSFESQDAYDQWKEREIQCCEQLKKKYSIPPSKKLLPLPSLPNGADFYVMPPSNLLQPYFVILTKLCLLHHRGSDSLLASSEDLLLFDHKTGNLLQLCARVWRIDYPTRAVSLFTAAHLSGLLIDPLFATDSKELGPIDMQTTKSVLHACKRTLEDGKLDWDDKHMWSQKDQDEWVRYLGYTYSDNFYTLKDNLSIVLSKNVTPKFGPYLEFLGDYIESDALFPKLAQLGIVQKWEKKLSRTFLRTSEALYVELLALLPRDDTVSVIHVLDIADKLIENIKFLQKKYKQPLLGFLHVGKSYAAVVTGMFASDSKNILKHIQAHAKARGEFLNYGDALEIYKSLCEIRSIHNQVSPKSVFNFDLEKFFYPYLESWVAESSDKIKSFVENALVEDKFEPMDIEDDSKKYSSSVHDIFTLIKHYLGILKGLSWQNEFQLAKIYTLLIKSISNCCLLYANEISEMVLKDLSEEAESKTETVKPPEQSGWLAEVKSIVNNIQYGGQKIPEEPVNFTPRTCIGLNNLSAMIQHLAKLEELLDPESISSEVTKSNPSSKNYYKSHIFTIRVVKAENLCSSSERSTIRPYVTIVDTQAKKMRARTRTLQTENPEWDEEFEITLPANTPVTLSTTVWEEKFGTHGVCGRALVQLEPRKFKHDGIPQEIYLDLDPQGRLLIEIAVESEREDAIFAMGRAHRALKRSQQRLTKLIVAKFSNFIKLCFSRQTLRSVCGNSGNTKPTQAQMDEAMLPLYNYLNMNLLVLAQYLTKELLLSVMLEAWNVVVSCADELLLPKLASAKIIQHSLSGAKGKYPSSGNLKMGWQSAVSAVANVTNSISHLGFGKTLTNNEIETVIAWLNFLCFDFFHNEGNGPPIHDLKNEQYQSLLLIPVYYDSENLFLKQEVERLSPAYLQTLRDKNNMYVASHHGSAANLRSRAGSIARSLTIRANATAKARAKAEKEKRELLSDPLAAQTSAENIILRLLLIKEEKQFVARRVEQRERLAHTIATERLAKVAAEGNLF